MSYDDEVIAAATAPMDSESRLKPSNMEVQHKPQVPRAPKEAFGNPENPWESLQRMVSSGHEKG